MRPLARKALEMIQKQGGKVIDMDLIERTLREIGAEYRPGLLAWLKSQPDRWNRLLDLEDRINQGALKKDEVGLTRALTEYKSFFLRMGEDFEAPQGATGNLFL